MNYVIGGDTIKWEVSTYTENQINELLRQIIKRFNGKETFIIGIDGLGGSGKTTLVNLLKSQLINKDYNPVVLHIDDFIHTRHVRYKKDIEEWYCYYNIQWRYDYLIKEILKPVKDGMEINKKIELYDKAKDTYFLEQTKIPQGSVLLLEGVFLQRRELKEYLDYIIYLEVSKDLRLDRVITRDKYIGNEEDIKSKYERRYFPAEDKYIEEYSATENADFVLK